MLCAKYDYKMDIAVKKEEAYLEKAIETATNLLKMNLLSPEQISQSVDLPLEQVIELQSSLKK